MARGSSSPAALTKGKAPRPGGILNEMIVYGGRRLIESLTQLSVSQLTGGKAM